jgi:hypothetical protein
MKELVMGLAGLAVLAAPLTASAEPYGHGRDGGREVRGDYGRGYYGGGAALAAGVAGLAIGAAIADQGGYGYAPAYGYAPPYEYGYGYAPRCFWQSQPYRTYYGDIAYRQVQVCR